MAPYLPYILPVSHAAVLDGVQSQHSALALRLVLDELSFWSMPSVIPGIFGRPATEGNTAFSASSPAKPALDMPLPLLTTKAAVSCAVLRSPWGAPPRVHPVLPSQGGPPGAEWAPKEVADPTRVILEAAGGGREIAP